MLTGLLAKIALPAFLKPVAAFLRSIPWQVWAAIALGLIIWRGIAWHERTVDAAFQKGVRSGIEQTNARWQQRFDKQKAEAAKLAAEIRRITDEQARHIAADADALRLRGPGKASCPGTTPAARPGGYVAPAGSGNVTVDQVPDGERIDLIALPFPGAIAFAEQHDQCRNDLLAYRAWEKQIRQTSSRPDE